ncbi:MAG: NusG domain II-containing protein [Pseudomonadota bacterium]
MLNLIKPGDWLTLLAGALFTAWLFAFMWQGGAAEKAVVRAGGKVYAEMSLAREQVLEVPGPLGVSQVAVEHGRARIARDPSPRQYCVRQGWLSQAGEIAVCLPNQVSLELVGRVKRYDSLNY